MWTKEWLDDRFAAVARPRRAPARSGSTSSASTATARNCRQGRRRAGRAARTRCGSGWARWARPVPSSSPQTIREHLRPGKVPEPERPAGPRTGRLRLAADHGRRCRPAGRISGHHDRGLRDATTSPIAQPAQTRYSNANWSVDPTPFRVGGAAHRVRRDRSGDADPRGRRAVALPVPGRPEVRLGSGLPLGGGGPRARLADGRGRYRRRAARQPEGRRTYSWDAAQQEGRAFLRGVDHLPNTVAHVTVQTYRRPVR